MRSASGRAAAARGGPRLGPQGALAPRWATAMPRRVMAAPATDPARSPAVSIPAHWVSAAAVPVERRPPARPPPSVRRRVTTRIPTQHGEFDVMLYHFSADPVEKDHLCIVSGDVDAMRSGGPVLCRVHSECLTGEVLGSRLCDCAEQLDRGLAQIAAEGGIVLYLRQEGRGIGLLEKLKAYNLQRLGHDTVTANRLLGHEDDARDFSVAALILQDLGVSSVRLVTNNPLKVKGLVAHGVDVVERVPQLPRDVSEHNERYLRTKAERMQHILDPDALSGSSHLT
eukprot:TRINITY_DN4606_c2_g1_i1.p1 TRINITY_DN4606_c2_g1~~TRINITY_DN4606_c2_g1_i1.p1  ORF type:complete len:318 (+),score=103.38 TRINITY_DN4606_c2_g1_i1:105-956(+)